MMEVRAFVDRVLDAAKAAGIDPAEVSVSAKEAFSTRVRKGAMEDYQVSDRVGLSLRGRVNGRIGTASTQALDEESIGMLVRGVIDSAELIETDEQDEILPPDAHYGEVVNCRPELEGVSAEEKIALAMEIDRQVASVDPRVEPQHTVVASGSETFSLRNTLGLDLSHESNMVYAYAGALARDGERAATGMKLLWGYDMKAVDAGIIAREATGEALDKLHAGRMKSGSYPVVIRSGAMADLLSTFCGVFSADNAQKGLSLLAGREGEAVASPLVTLVDDPLMPWGLGSCPFDREGAATYKKNVIENGVLTTLLHNRKTAKKAGVRTTGNAAGSGRVAPSNLFIAPGTATEEELLGHMGDGLYLTDVTGLHAGANAVSVDFSLLSCGFEVKDGKKVRAVEQFTVAGNFYQLLADVLEVGDNLLFDGSPIGSPSVRVKALSVAGE